jgi:hypothetical protein
MNPPALAVHAFDESHWGDVLRFADAVVPYDGEGIVGIAAGPGPELNTRSMRTTNSAFPSQHLEEPGLKSMQPDESTTAPDAQGP